MKTSDRGLAEIVGHEAICLRPYFDSVGVLTFGIGHTKPAGDPDPASLPRDSDQPIEMVLELFRKDMRKFEADVNAALKVPVSQPQFDALVSFHYNTGKIASATLTKKINAGDIPGAIAQFDRWHIPPEITERRNKEQRLFATGEYSNGGKALLTPVSPRGVPQYSKATSVNVLQMLTAPAAAVPSAPAPMPRPRPTSPVEPSHDAPAPETAGDAAKPTTGLLAWFLKLLAKLW